MRAKSLEDPDVQPRFIGPGLSTLPREERFSDGPAVGYWLMAIAFVLVVGTYAALNPRLSEGGTDLWQHLAALNAILENPFSPMNPFVESQESSRLFGPFWVTVGLVGQAVGWSPLQAFAAGGFLNLALLVTGTFLFARRYFASAFAPHALFIALFLGWVLPPSFTGYHSPLTLLSGAAYPSMTVVGGALILWSVAIGVKEGKSRGLSVIPLVALLFATHPLGTSVALAGTVLIGVLWPGDDWKRTALLAAHIVAGLALSAAWPYFNPFSVLTTAASGQWTAGQDHYSGAWLISCFVPAAIGIFGLLNGQPKQAAMLALLGLCTAGYLAGLSPAFVAGHRLLPFMVLVLHIGIAELIIRFWSASRLTRATLIAISVPLALVQTAFTLAILQARAASVRHHGSLLASARLLLADVPGGITIAGDWTGSFALAATGRRVLSTPLAEPMVHDLARRQQATARLLDPRLTRQQRLAIAAPWNVRAIVLDNRSTSGETLRTLGRQSRRIVRAGSLTRFDL